MIGGLVLGLWAIDLLLTIRDTSEVYRHYSPAELAYLDRLWVMNSDRLIQCQ